MAFDPILKQNNKVITAVSMTSNIVSSISDISECKDIAVHAIYTGSPVGSLEIRGSNNGVDFGLLETSTAISSSGNVIRNFANLGCTHIRINYVFTSGTGSLTVHVSGKV